MRIALAQINPIVGSLTYNTQKIIQAFNEARRAGIDIVVMPEMAITGYPPEDLLLQPSFIQAVELALNTLVEASKNLIAIVGCVRKNPDKKEKGLFNCAAVMQEGSLLGFQDKILLPDYDVFSERRYFEPGLEAQIWSLKGYRVAITICEDIWQHAGAVGYSIYLRDPIMELKSKRPDILINLSASPYYMRRHETRRQVCLAAVQTLECPLFFCNQVGGNDSLIFDGYSMYIEPKNKSIRYAKGFREDFLIIDTAEESPPCHPVFNPVEDLFHALVLGVRDYFHKLGWEKACLGLSGGIDSSVVAVIATKALGSKNVFALSLPSPFSSEECKSDAKKLAQQLGIQFTEVPIDAPFASFLSTLAPHFQGMAHDVTEENIQARIRGVLLMAYSNKFHCLLLNTGNKSELAMGYATLYGDMCGGLGVLEDVTKEQVYALAHWINKSEEIIPQTVILRPPSAELRPNQKDTDSLPEYPIVDRILEGYVEDHLSSEELAAKYHLPLKFVKELVRKIHLNEYKRRQAPPGLRVTKKAFSIGRRFPIVQHWNMEPLI